MIEQYQKIICKIKLFLHYGAILFGVITAYAYLLGLTYYQGYMSAFGFSVDVFPKSVADTYVDSYAAAGLMIADVFKLIVSTKSIGFLFLITGLFSALLEGLNYLNKSKFPKKLLDRFSKQLSSFDFKKFSIYKVARVLFGSYYLFFGLLVAILYLWWGPPHWAEQKGRSIANDQIQNYLEHDCSFEEKTGWNNCVCLTNKDKATHEGLLVAQNEKYIAIFKKDGGYIFSLGDIDSLRKSRN